MLVTEVTRRRPAHEHEALAAVRTVVTAPLDPSTGERLRAPLDARVVETYGPAAAGVALANPLTADARPGTAGPALPGTRARIAVEGFPEVDVLPGHAGELLLRGPRIGDLAGLRGRPAGDGWLRTGRLAVRGPDGSVTLLDDGDGRGGAAPRHRRRRPAGRGRRPGAAPRRGRRGRRCAAPPRRPAGPVLSPG
ncbi:AMP-binding protein [Streptomyces chilikensis]|uniref:AMP-binding protein n=1 Tax=Streptomyces chilikensis TaxID=1194079 RepID=UPI00140AD691|nr:AMP-binding protein [Streptomyces chilikensis]